MRYAFVNFKKVNDLIIKRAIIILLTVALAIGGCNKKQKQKPYMLTMSVMKYDKKGKPFYLDRRREAILAADDTTAYYQALQIVAMNRIDESKVASKLTEKTIKFELKYGIHDIKESFPPETIGRLNRNFIKLHPEISLQTVNAVYHKS